MSRKEEEFFKLMHEVEEINEKLREAKLTRAEILSDIRTSKDAAFRRDEQLQSGLRDTKSNFDKANQNLTNVMKKIGFNNNDETVIKQYLQLVDLIYPLMTRIKQSCGDFCLALTMCAKLLGQLTDFEISVQTYFEYSKNERLVGLLKPDIETLEDLYCEDSIQGKEKFEELFYKINERLADQHSKWLETNLQSVGSGAQSVLMSEPTQTLTLGEKAFLRKVCFKSPWKDENLMRAELAKQHLKACTHVLPVFLDRITKTLERCASFLRMDTNFLPTKASASQSPDSSSMSVSADKPDATPERVLKTWDLLVESLQNLDCWSKLRNNLEVADLPVEHLVESVEKCCQHFIRVQGDVRKLAAVAASILKVRPGHSKGLNDLNGFILFALQCVGDFDVHQAHLVNFFFKLKISFVQYSITDAKNTAMQIGGQSLVDTVNDLKKIVAECRETEKKIESQMKDCVAYIVSNHVGVTTFVSMVNHANEKEKEWRIFKCEYEEFVDRRLNRQKDLERHSNRKQIQVESLEEAKQHALAKLAKYQK